jgi:hypothetical protein
MDTREQVLTAVKVWLWFVGCETVLLSSGQASILKRNMMLHCSRQKPKAIIRDVGKGFG